MRLLITLAFILCLGCLARAEEPASKPLPVPVTRPEMKRALDSLKKAKPRLPLPPLTEEKKARYGKRGVVNNGRARMLYLPAELYSADFARGADPAMTLSHEFKTMLFWIVSRVNNCYYWLGHQENKLAVAGLTEEKIAALDGDWSEFTPAQRAAFALARGLTHEPHRLAETDLQTVRKHYKDLQALEIVLTVASNNSTTRWTEALGLPQEEHRKFVTPTPAKFEKPFSRVASFGSVRNGVAPPQPAKRALESREQVEKALAACRKRTPRLPLADREKARELLGDGWGKGELPQWVLLLANFPKAGKSRILGLRAAAEKGTLPARLKAQVAWIAARHDRAWYALGQARQRLTALGQSADQIFALDGKHDGYTAGERAAFALARKLTIAPATITDEDIAILRKHYSDRQVAELVYHVATAAFFDRLTEAAGLRLEK